MVPESENLGLAKLLAMEKNRPFTLSSLLAKLALLFAHLSAIGCEAKGNESLWLDYKKQAEEIDSALNHNSDYHSQNGGSK